jgi:hypothetical protein
MRRCKWCLVALPLILVTVGCVSTLPPPASTYSFDRRCVSVSSEVRSPPVSLDEQRRTPNESFEKDAAVKLYSPIAIHIADVTDLLPLLNRMARLEIEQAALADIEHVRQKVITRLVLATLEVSGLVAEIECEVQRADQVQDRLKDIQTTRITSQTILGVIFGGLANVLSGGIAMATGAGDAGNIASVTGGALEVVFGTSANFTKVRQEFSHPRNHLAAVWGGSPQSEFFSQRAWRFLTEPGVRGLEGHSLRDVMLQTWHEEGKLGEVGSVREKERVALLFGAGGVYDSEQLHVREAMLEQLESSIQLMHQELETLLREVMVRQALEEKTHAHSQRPAGTSRHAEGSASSRTPSIQTPAIWTIGL